MISADQDGADGSGIGTAGKLEELRQQGAGGHFDDSMFVQRARVGDEHRSWIVGIAHRSEPLGSESCDQSHVGQRLDVVDQGGPSAQPGYGGECGAVARQCRSALDSSDRR